MLAQLLALADFPSLSYCGGAADCGGVFCCVEVRCVPVEWLFIIVVLCSLIELICSHFQRSIRFGVVRVV